MLGSANQAEIAQIRQAIEQFLKKRLEEKLNKIQQGEDDKRQKLQEEHLPEAWIADAARRASQIRQVTHAVKYTHPDAKGSSLYSEGNSAVGDGLVGTHVLKQLEPDVVGNAAALDVYKFLREQVEGETLLERAQRDDPALAAAFSTDTEQARSWIRSFAAIVESPKAPSAHKLTKQLYWPLDDTGNDYHLLEPLFPTSLAHRLYQQIRTDRSSDTAKKAREARRNNQPYAHGYREYPDLAVVKFGGTKPQNISQLNSERHGEVYLLPALPPNWQSQGMRSPLYIDTIFGRWLNRFSHLRDQIKGLREFLVRVKAINNVHVRRTRAEWVGHIRDEVMLIAERVSLQSPGWSASPDCRLVEVERYWLDPRRATEDEKFAEARMAEDWRETIAHRFGNWLTAQIETELTPMDDATQRAFKDVLLDELCLMREELNDD